MNFSVYSDDLMRIILQLIKVWIHAYPQTISLTSAYNRSLVSVIGTKFSKIKYWGQCTLRRIFYAA